MDRKKNKGKKATVDSKKKSVQPEAADMSKYSRAVSNKSRINYAELKLVSSEQPKQPEPEGSKKDRKKPASGAGGGISAKNDGNKKAKEKKPKTKKDKRTKQKLSLLDERKRKTEDKGQAVSKTVQTGSTAEERYSNALGREDHYSSAVEKYYLKYPDAKRPEKKTAAQRADAPRKKKRRFAGGGKASTGGERKLSMAEIAVKNKSNTSIREHAKAARDARAKGTVSPKATTRSFHRRKKNKTSGAFRVLVFFVIAAVIVSVFLALFFDIKKIEVEGATLYTESQIKKLCSFGVGNNILFIDTKGTENKIKSELPYISECRVERKIPSRVVIKVSEAKTLGVAEQTENLWSVISTEGKILESVTNVRKGSTEADSKAVYSAKYGSVSEYAAEKGLPVIRGLTLKGNIEEGYLSDEAQLRHLGVFEIIIDAFENKKMKVTSVRFGERGYECDYEDRLTFIFGKETIRKNIAHHMDEVYTLIFVRGEISQDAKGTIRFRKNGVYFRPTYETSPEELEAINQQRLEDERKELIGIAEIFMKTGSEWFDGKLVPEG